MAKLQLPRISQVPAGRQDLLRARPQFDMGSCVWIEMIEILNPHEMDEEC